MGERDYKEALTLCNLLPPLYMKVLKELLLYNNIYLGHYDINFAEFAEIKWNGRSTTESNFQTSDIKHNAMTSGIELGTEPIS